MNPGIFEKRDSFLSLAFLPRVNGISGILTVPRVEFFKNASLSFSCERTKKKNFEYDDTIHCTTHAQSGMPHDRISTVLVLSWGQAKTIRMRQRILRKYSELK